MSCRAYDPFLTRKTPFLLCSYFHAHPTTLLLKILGGPMRMGRPPPHIWGDRPPRSPPLVVAMILMLRWSSLYNSLVTRRERRHGDKIIMCRPTHFPLPTVA